jgi:hypothetical protein
MSTSTNSLNSQIGSTSTNTILSQLRASAGQWASYADGTDIHGYFSGRGTPEGVVTANPGSIYSDTESPSTGLYFKENGTGNTGWILVNALAPPWVNSGPASLNNDTGYFATGAGVYTLPEGVNDGDTISIVDFIGGGVIITAQNGDAIRLGSSASAANGTATSTDLGDSLKLVFRLTGQVWVAIQSVGNWNIS